MGKFVNRVSQFPNRKVIKIVEETEDGLVADVVNDDRGLVNAGTPLSAEIFEEWNQIVTTASGTANEAKELANQATLNASSAVGVAETANTTAENALSIAEEVRDDLAAGSGTRVFVGESLQSSITFDSDPVEKINNAISRNELLDLIYPVGSIYLTVSTANPGTLFGGTWVRWGKGRAIVGEDSSDSDFTPVEHTYGSKSFQKHNHCVSINETTGLTGTLTFKTYSSATSCEGDIFVQTWSDSGVTPSGTSKDKNVTISVDANHKHTGTIDEHGAGTCGNLQPYIVCYTWKRTA